ncbi:putative F-box domain-containing protein [Zalerion maritima]|uniref:F-box domain-containing protein n=1 Tax=Zalerion maritima TaxID=339359 RepID=A0AAD5RWS3_9PEZI|nr:putative F-box domain-containing protein [Zalerion maritima]
MMSGRSGTFFLLRLPPELVDSVLQLLGPTQLARVGQTCRALHRLATSDVLWQRLVQANVPDVVVDSPYPFDNFRDLYVCHEPYWFLTRYKIWFCDHNLMGKMVVVRYDQRRGCIEGYLLLSNKKNKGFHSWPADPQVIIHAFEPRVKLHLDKPVLQLNPTTTNNETAMGSKPFQPELAMCLDEILHCNLMLARPLESLPGRYGRGVSYGVWPPPAVPASHRVGNSAPYGFADPEINTLPESRAEASDRVFRLRQWIEHLAPPRPSMINGRPLNPVIGTNPYPNIGLFGPAMAPAVVGRRSSVSEEVITYATLDPYLYTPTTDKPWRGIWVGDYCGHGCEFLLVHQPDDEEPPEPRRESESDEAYRNRRKFHGRLEAIKLTGDPNVPRGEYTFIADDLGDAGFVDYSNEPPFMGCRIVKSLGHIAGTGFQNDEYIMSQLVLINNNRLAQFWVGFGHISFFERVKIEDFLDPKTTAPGTRA